MYLHITIGQVKVFILLQDNDILPVNVFPGNVFKSQNSTISQQ